MDMLVLTPGWKCKDFGNVQQIIVTIDIGESAPAKKVNLGKCDI